MNKMFTEQFFKPIVVAQANFARFLRALNGLNKPAIIFPIALLIFAGLGCRMFQSSPHKTDAQLTAEFQQNKKKFERLVEMVKEDKIQVSVYEIEKGLIKEISSSRIEEYKKLLGNLNLFGVYPVKIDKDSGSITQIQFKSSFYEKKGEYICEYTEDKGLIWYETGKQPANREVKNLDREYTKGRDIKAESRIDDNWSLYYSYETCVKD